MNQEDAFIRGRGTKEEVWQCLLCKAGLPLQESAWDWRSFFPPTSPFGSQDRGKIGACPAALGPAFSPHVDSAFEAGGQPGVQALGVLTRPGCGRLLPLITSSKFIPGKGTFRRVTGSLHLHVCSLTGVLNLGKIVSGQVTKQSKSKLNL